MPDRDSNIELDLTDSDASSVQRQSDEEIDDHQEFDEDIPEYATPPDPPGTVTTENVPESPLAAKINQFTQQIDRPDEFTSTELQVIAISRLHPELTTTDVADRLDVSATTVSQATRRARLAELSERSEIYAAFQERTEGQQKIISVLVDRPDCSRDQLAAVLGYSQSGIASIERNHAPLIRKLREMGLPDDYDVPSLDSIDESASTRETDQSTNLESKTVDNEPTATDSSAMTAPVPNVETAFFNENVVLPQSELHRLRRFVVDLRNMAATERSLSDSPVGQQSSAARQAVCDSILIRIDTLVEDSLNTPHELQEDPHD